MDQAGSACAWCEFTCVAECHGWPGPPRHELTWLSITLTPVDILPKPTASTRPWRVHHLQACHGPAGAQLHLQDTCEIRGPGKPLRAPPGHLQRSRPGLRPLGSAGGRVRWVGYKLASGAVSEPSHWSRDESTWV